MATIRSGYPTKLTDDEIVQLIAEYQDDIFSSRANVNTVIQLAPMVELGVMKLTMLKYDNNERRTH